MGHISISLLFLFQQLLQAHPRNCYAGLLHDDFIGGFFGLLLIRMIEQFVGASRTADDRNITFRNRVHKFFHYTQVPLVARRLVIGQRPLKVGHHFIRLYLGVLIGHTLTDLCQLQKISALAAAHIQNILGKRQVALLACYFV